MSTPVQIIAAFAMALAFVVSAHSGSHAQAPMSVPGKSAPAKAQPPLPPVGEACTRADNKRGVVAEDACGRKACVLKFGQKIPAAEKGLTRRAGCEWTLIDNRCECVVRPAKAPQKSK